MNAVVDPTNEPGDLDGLEKQLSDAVTENQVTDKAENTVPDPKQLQSRDTNAADNIPDKYKGKNLLDVIEMHQNVESKLGRVNNDLGTQRKLTDKLLDLKRTDDLQNNSPDPLPEVSSTELLDKPTETLDKYISERENRLRAEYEERLASLEVGLAQDRFVTKHPDYAAVSNDPAFSDWIAGSAIRSQAAQQALAGDWNIADALLTEFKEARPAAPNADSASEEAKASAKAANLTSSSAESPSGASDGGKVYRRRDLMRLKLEKPEVYSDPQFQEEIMRAYAEKRVK